MSDSRPVTRTLACGSKASPPVEKGKRGWRRFSAGSLASGTILAFESFSIFQLHSSKLMKTVLRPIYLGQSRGQTIPWRTPICRTSCSAEMANPHATCASQSNRNFVVIQHQSGKGLNSGRDTEGQKEATCSDAPVFGREFNCISTLREVKLAEQESVQLTQSAASLPLIGLAES